MMVDGWKVLRLPLVLPYRVMQLVSVELFARYWFCVIVGMVAAVVFLVLILVQIQNSMAATVLKRVSLAVGMSRVFWDTTSSNIGAMSHLAAQLQPLRRLLDQPTNATLHNMTTELLYRQAIEHKLEHFLLTDANRRVIWSVNPGSNLVGNTMTCFHARPQVF